MDYRNDIQNEIDNIPAYIAQAKPTKSVDELIEAVIKRESSGNPKAVSRVGARGLMQIMPVVLTEYNQFNKTNFNSDDLFNPDINRAIGTWYMNVRIPQMLKYYNIPDTLPNRLKSYNMGIGNLKKGKDFPETRSYVENILKDLER